MYNITVVSIHIYNVCYKNKGFLGLLSSGKTLFNQGNIPISGTQTPIVNTLRNYLLWPNMHRKLKARL